MKNLFNYSIKLPFSMKKILVVLLCSTFCLFSTAQKADNSIIAGVWQLKSINCEKYYSYDGYKKEFKIGDELKNLMSLIPAADSKAATEAMPGLVAKDVQQTYFLFETNEQYIAISTDSIEVGSFEVYKQEYKEYKANHRLELKPTKWRESLILKKDSRNKEEQLILTEKKDPPSDLLMLKMFLDPEEDEFSYKTTYTYTYIKLIGAEETAAMQKLKDARQSKHRDEVTIATMEIKKKKAVLKADEEANGKVYTTADKKPAFAGGDAAYASHVEKILKYYRPREYGAGAGTYFVNISFTVNTDGTLSQIVAEDDTDFGFAKKAIEIFSKSPNWIPAEDNGVKVRYRQTKKITLVVPKDEWGE
jgi:hypothetical protein